MKETQLPDGEIYKPKTDRYQKVRGESQILDIKCASCNELVLVYQKDGPGPLLRCYLDRIAWPNVYRELSSRATKMADLTNVCCPNCQNQLGSPMIYQKEKRLAYFMRKGAFSKRRRA